MYRYHNPWHRPGEHHGPESYATNAAPVPHAGYLIFERIRGRAWDVVQDGVCLAQRADLAGALRAAEHLQRLETGAGHAGTEPWLWRVDGKDGATWCGTVQAADPHDALSRALTSDDGQEAVRRYRIPVEILSDAPGNADPCWSAAGLDFAVSVRINDAAVFARLDAIASSVRRRLRGGTGPRTLHLGGEVPYLEPAEMAQRDALIRLLAAQTDRPGASRIEAAGAPIPAQLASATPASSPAQQLRPSPDAGAGRVGPHQLDLFAPTSAA